MARYTGYSIRCYNKKGNWGDFLEENYNREQCNKKS